MMEDSGDGTARATGVQHDDLEIPLIDFALFRTGTQSEKHSVGVAITKAFKESGFLYLRNHGIEPSVVYEVFGASAKFFSRPQEQKDELRWTTPQANRGYVAPGREKLSDLSDKEGIEQMRKRAPDLEESLEIGAEGVAGFPNRWPDHLDDDGVKFTETMKKFFLTCQELHLQMMKAIALGMGLSKDFFEEHIDDGNNNLRLLHYPPVPKAIFSQGEGRVRAGEHSDYGSITFLFQDAHGGLQVRSSRDTFINAIPIPDTIVVNAGDLLARWSNDIIKSTRHRVVEPIEACHSGGKDEEEEEEYASRYSIAYFCNPNNEAFIDAMPGTYGGSRGKRYQGIRTADYLVQKLSATY